MSRHLPREREWAGVNRKKKTQNSQKFERWRIDPGGAISTGLYTVNLVSARKAWAEEADIRYVHI